MSSNLTADLSGNTLSGNSFEQQQVWQQLLIPTGGQQHPRGSSIMTSLSRGRPSSFDGSSCLSLHRDTLNWAWEEQELDASNALMKLSQKPPVEASESSISARSPATIQPQASIKKRKHIDAKGGTWSGYKLFNSYLRHCNECDFHGIQPHTLESYAAYIGQHGQPPPRRRTSKKKRRTYANGDIETMGRTAQPPSARFEQYSNNISAQWNELEDKEREQYTTEAKIINKCIVTSRHQQLNRV
jgi:hypothetical protein